MKKIFQSVLLISGLAIAAVAPPGNLANATDGAWALDQNMMLIPTWIDPSSSFLDATFNMNNRFDVGAKQICVFTYDEEKVPQRQAEAEIKDFQTADWAKGVQCREFTAEHHSVVGLSAVIADKSVLSNRSGVFYYAINVERWGAEGADWIWGKIDHHYCSYDSATTPHLSVPCSWGGDIDTNTFLLRRSGKESAEYMPWAEEWRQDLASRVADFEKEVESWSGDEHQRDDIIDRLETAQLIAADANEANVLQAQFQELLDKMQQKIADLAPTEPEKPPVLEQPENPLLPEQPDVPTNPETPKVPDNSGNNANQGSNSSSSSGNTEINKPSSDQANNQIGGGGLDSQDKIGVAIKPSISPSTDSMNNPVNIDVATSVMMTEPDKNDQRSEKSEQNTNFLTENSAEMDNIEIPALREDKNQGWLGWIILVIASIAGATVWWCRRAFWVKPGARH